MNDQDLIKEFLVESHENLDQLDKDLVALEKDPRARQRLGSVFRTVHTIKGTSGFFGFGKLEEVTHAGESLLSRLRDGFLDLTPEITSGLLALVDMIRRILANIENTGREGTEDSKELVATLSRLKGGSLILPPEKPQAAGSADADTPLPSLAVKPVPPAGTQDPLPASSGEEQSGEAHAEHPAADAPAGTLAEGHIRVDVNLLDKLMNLVGELVLARNQIVQHSACRDDGPLTGMAQRLNQIATDLQEGVMKTRMQPISNVWNKFPRMARDLALACGKRVRLVLEGADTELDRTILEAIKDPLTHLLRNGVDHGIENPEARRARGKSQEGLLVLRAFHEGGHVNIEVSDDGAGVNVERVKQKALEKVLLTREEAGRLNDRQVLDLILLPGFSTAQKLTSVSGRGVGLDVVKTNIEKIGGTLDIQSRPGQGLTVKIKIPLTLAIIPALIVTCAGERFAIPQASLLELVRLEEDKQQRGIEWVHGVPVYRLRGNLLPLVDLARELKLPSKPAGIVNIVVLQADERRFGLIVDKVNDTQEIVVKPLGKLVKSIPLFAGATILGDGKVVLILDVFGVALVAQVVSEVRNRAPVEETTHSVAGRDDRQKLLLCELGGSRRVALPFSNLARLEEIAASAVEKAAEQEVMQCRGGILPLIRLSRVLGRSEPEPVAEPDALQIVVYADAERSVGLVVGRIVDIVESGKEIQREARQPGLLGSTVINGRVTDLVDVPRVLDAWRATGRDQLCLAGAGV